MKQLSVVFVLLMGLMSAQNQRFTYEYKFAKTEKDIDSLRSEMMALDVTENGSRFYSWDKKVSDSIMMVSIKKQMKLGKGINIDKTGYKGEIRYEVTKEYPDFNINFTDSFGGYSYEVEDPRKMTWKISSETKKIGEWDCQKATTYFAGRTWDVWFTSSIPITDGPYKFRGLPGLIVEAKCKEGIHHFTLVGAKKLPKKVGDDKSDYENAFSLRSRRKPIQLSLKKYAKQKERYLKDPNASIKQMLMGNGRSSSGGTVTKMVLIGKDGKKMSKAEMLRTLNKKSENQPKRTPIELDLFK